MNEPTVFTFPMLDAYARTRRWLIFIAFVMAILGASELFVSWMLARTTDLLAESGEYNESMAGYLYASAIAVWIFAIAAIGYARAIGRAVRSTSRTVALDGVVAAQLWFWRICGATSLALVAISIFLGVN